MWEFGKKNRPKWRHSTRSRIWTCQEFQFLYLKTWQCTSSFLKFFNCLRNLQTCSCSFFFLIRWDGSKITGRSSCSSGALEAIHNEKGRFDAVLEWWFSIQSLCLQRANVLQLCSLTSKKDVNGSTRKNCWIYILSQKAWYNKQNSWNSWLIIPLFFFLELLNHHPHHPPIIRVIKKPGLKWMPPHGFRPRTHWMPCFTWSYLLWRLGGPTFPTKTLMVGGFGCQKWWLWRGKKEMVMNHCKDHREQHVGF